MSTEVDFLSYFRDLDDPRVDRTKRYPLIEIIFLVTTATISGCEGWKAIRDFGVIKLDWLRKFLPYKEGIPVDDTIARVMRKLDTKQFQKCFVSWMKEVTITKEGDLIAVDGKTVRGSADPSNEKSAIHMVSAWSTENSMVLGQEKTAEKSNEITAIPELLETLDIKGSTISIDAMGCQHKIASKIIKKKADYILALKGNQGHLHADVEDFFSNAIRTNFNGIDVNYHKEVDSGHGRIETRECWVLDPNNYPGCFDKLEKWDKLRGILMVKTKRGLKDKTTEDTRFYITSCFSDAKNLLSSVRKHWQIENSLHWTLDCTFHEDASRVRADAAPENYAVIRHIALNILRNYKSIKASVKRKIGMCALDDGFRYKVVHSFL